MQAHLLEIWRKIDITIVFITHDLDEAIYLADRILVLSAHPGEVQELIEVPVPRPRSVQQFVSPAFLATKARLEELIYIGRHAPEQEEQDEDYPILARMTNVGDNVE
jgi:NitT/TauT family transport system ATP-binding protein